jgi:hypothetical protein
LEILTSKIFKTAKQFYIQNKQFSMIDADVAKVEGDAASRRPRVML